MVWLNPPLRSFQSWQYLKPGVVFLKRLMDSYFLTNILRKNRKAWSTKKLPQRYPSITTQNTVVLPNFLAWKFCGNAQFMQSLGDSPKTLRKLCVFAKFPYQKIRWNYAILRSVWGRINPFVPNAPFFQPTKTF